MTVYNTFTATIYLGFKDTRTGELCDSNEIRNILQNYVDTKGFCVSVTRTEFIYSNDGEPGFAIGIINYPRFPMTVENLKERTLEIAEKLRVFAKQQRVSVVFPDETIMLSES